MTLSSRERILVLIGLCVLLLGAFAWFWYLPHSRNIASLEELNHSLQGEIEKLQAVPVSAAPDPAAAEAAVEQMEASFPLQPDQVTVMDILNKAAKGTDLVLKAMSNDGNSAAEHTGRLVFDVRTQGGFHDTMDFLTRLEEEARISAVDNIVLTAVKRKAESSGATVTVTESGSAGGTGSTPVYFLQPLLAPAAKSLPAQPESTEKAAAAPADTEKRQALNLVPGQVETQMQVTFYYYNEKSDAAEKNKTQKSTAK
jgi:Tfp pilus assembly protein PilO